VAPAPRYTRAAAAPATAQGSVRELSPGTGDGHAEGAAQLARRRHRPARNAQLLSGRASPTAGGALKCRQRRRQQLPPSAGGGYVALHWSRSPS